LSCGLVTTSQFFASVSTLTDSSGS
jgi:hypothetical protein